jgi:hypothetical protein
VRVEQVISGGLAVPVFALHAQNEIALDGPAEDGEAAGLLLVTRLCLLGPAARRRVPAPLRLQRRRRAARSIGCDAPSALRR